MYNAKGKIRSSEMIDQNMPLVKQVACQIKLRVPSHVELDDLIQSGMLGLLDAVKKYEPTQGIRFEVYARQRINGSIMDELRKSSWAPRRTREIARDIERAIKSLSIRLGRQPNNREIAEEMNVSIEEYGQLLLESNMSTLVSFEELGVEQVDQDSLDHYSSPLESLVEAGERGRVADAIGALPEKEKQLMALYYQEEMTLKEIGAVFGVSESRICQLHSQTLARLRVALAPA